MFRTAVAFTQALKPADVLGADRPSVLLTVPALRSMIARLDVIGVVIDPVGAMSRPAKRVA
ncbi:hypothetical protein [Nonomuraea sp. NPDC003201]